MDPTRIERSRRLLANLRRPASGHPIDRVLWWLTAAGFVSSIVMALVFWTTADRWWLATVLLFGPRWTLLVPLVPVAALAASRDRPLLLPLAATGWIIVGPVMGFQTGWRGAFTLGNDRDIVIATYNARGGADLAMGPGSMMVEWGADIAAFQECGSELRAAISAMSGWHTHVSGSLCFVSRFTILETSTMQRDVLASIGGSGLVTTYTLAGEQGPFLVTNIHLETPRAGLELVRVGRIGEGRDSLNQSSILREIELRRAQRFAAQATGPHIVVGDFNTPPESRVYRAEWGDWTNAFSRAGFGIGGTRLSGWIRARIDHVLVDGSWKIVGARMGEDLGSDHLPMIGTLRLR